MKLFQLLLLFILCSVSYSTLIRREKVHEKRHRHRHVRRYPVRNERTAEHCGADEHHVVCGPEKHCDKSCENLWSPPHCIQNDSHPKCYHPRCVCNDGLVRSADGKCIKQTACPNTYFEPSKGVVQSNDMTVRFKPMSFSRIGKYRLRRIRRPRKNHVKQIDLSL